jgi:glycerol-3-phosphate dehydrogenase
MEHPEESPRAAASEIAELLETAGRMLTIAPTIADVKAVFAGVRPLLAARGKGTASASREHLLEVSPGGLVTITGGKWTTYRSMAAAAVDRVAALGGLPPRASQTSDLRIEGAAPPEGVPVHDGDVRRAARDEMARTVEDVLARRLSTLMVDARAAVAAAPRVASLLREEFGRDATWEQTQVERFLDLARECLPVGAADW